MNRKHELYLINLGLETLLERVSTKHTIAKKNGKKKGKWTKKQHKKFAETMSRKFSKKQK